MGYGDKTVIIWVSQHGSHDRGLDCLICDQAPSQDQISGYQDWLEIIRWNGEPLSHEEFIAEYESEVNLGDSEVTETEGSSELPVSERKDSQRDADFTENEVSQNNPGDSN
jgi:hypothetical protein